MKKLYLLFLLLLPFLCACKNNCKGIDCLHVESFAFTIKSGTTGEDLLFGKNAQLKQEEVEVYYMLNGAKQPAQIRFMTDHVQVTVDPEITAYYVAALGQTDAVKLAVSRTSSSECCPSTSVLEQLTVNNQDVPVDYRTIILTR